MIAWIDVAQDSLAIDPTSTPDAGVCYRTPDGRWRVAVDDMRKPEAERRWIVWDMRGRVPVRVPLPTAEGCPTRDRAFSVAASYASSRGLRVFVVAVEAISTAARILIRAARDLYRRERQGPGSGAGVHVESYDASAEGNHDVASARGNETRDDPPEVGGHAQLHDGPVRGPAEKSRPRRRRRKRGT